MSGLNFGGVLAAIKSVAPDHLRKVLGLFAKSKGVDEIDLSDPEQVTTLLSWLDDYYAFRAAFGKVALVNAITSGEATDEIFRKLGINIIEDNLNDREN